MPTVPAAGYPTGPDVPPPISPAPFGEPQDFLRIDARPEAFGAQVGGALSQAGTRLEQGAGELAQAAISRQEFFNSVAADNASTEYMKESHKIFYGDPDAGVNPVTGQANKPGFFALKGQDAINAGSPNDQLDELQKRIAANLPNDRARLLFNSETRKLRTYTDGEISRHWDEQLKTAGDATLAAKGDLHERDAATYFNDPGRLAQILEDGRNDITKRAQVANGMNADPAILADARAKEDARLYGSAFRAAIAAGNTDRADQLNKEAVARGIFTGQQAEEANRLIQEKRDANLAAGAANRALGRPSSGGGGGAAPAGVPPAAIPPDQYKPVIDQAAAQYNVPPELLTRMLSAENDFKPTGRSSAGAEGIAQFIPETAKKYGVDVNDTTSSIMGAAHYLADLKAQTGSWHAALRGYLGGEPMNDVSYTKKGVWQYADHLDRGGAPAPGAQPAAAAGGATPPPAGASIPPQATVFPSSGKISVWGDSIGKDLQAKLGVSGTNVVSAQPPAIRAAIEKEPPGSWAGQTVVLSSGSNGQHMDDVEATIKYLQEHNANVVLIGYGTDTKASLPQKNAQLREMAGRLKVPVVDLEDPISDGVHPGTSGVTKMVNKIQSIHTQFTASTPPAADGKPQTVPAGGIIHNPKTGEYLQNVGGKLVTYLPPGV